MRQSTSILFCCLIVVGVPQSAFAQDSPPSLLDQLKAAVANVMESAGSADVVDEQPVTAVTWHPTLEQAVEEARESGKPIFAVVGAPWCSFCEKLQLELKGEGENKIAERWVLAKINADDEVNDARELRANALPALRLLSSDGVVTASHDGYAPVSQLTRWLDVRYELTKAQMPGLLTKEIAELDESEIETLIGLMAIRDVTARRVVLNRLGEMPQHAVHPAIDLLASGRLADQLSALQLLRTWGAPLAGLDPWEPASISDAAVGRLKAWGLEKYPAESIE